MTRPVLLRLRARFALLTGWRVVLRRAWSARLLLVAIVLSGLEVVLPMFSDAISRGWFAVASFAVTAGALWARLVYQPTLYPGADHGDTSAGQ